MNRSPCETSAFAPTTASQLNLPATALSSVRPVVAVVQDERRREFQPEGRDGVAGGRCPSASS